MEKPDLRVNLGGLVLESPILAASGPFGYGHQYRKIFDFSQLGAFIVKGVSSEPWEGNPAPRLAETASGLLNSVGLQNPGLKSFLSSDLPLLRDCGTKVIVNIVGRTVEEYAAVASGLDGADGIDGLEVNISCPNLKAGGMAFGTDPDATSKVVGAVRKETSMPLLVKLSPNVTDIKTIALAAEDAGADALSLINTLSGMTIDIDSGRPFLGNIFGGLSGPAILPVALKMVWQASEAVRIPLLGMGGITTSADVVRFMLAGAGAVAVGTGIFYNPEIVSALKEGLLEYMMKKKIYRVEDLRALAHRGGFAGDN